MPKTTPDSSGSRLRQIMSKIDEKEGAPPRPAAEIAAAPAPAAPAPTALAQLVRPARGAAARAEAAAVRQPSSVWENFKNFAIVFSFVINVVLVVTVILLIASIFEIKRAVAAPLVDGLYSGFVQMDAAHIRTEIPVSTTIQVSDTMPVVFDLPLQQNTNVTLSENTLITGASVTIAGGILQLNNAPTTILLPKGAVLPVTLNLTVPVSQTIPVNLPVPVSLVVPVDIPLQQTELHQPFSSLRDLFAPYYALVSLMPDSWGQLAGLR